MKKSFTDYAEKELAIIHSYSEEHNRLRKKNHALALLDLIEEHIKEVKDLHRKEDEHYLIELGDIIVMCLSIIKDANSSPDEILSRCYERFHKKLLRLIESVKSSKEKLPSS